MKAICALLFWRQNKRKMLVTRGRISQHQWCRCQQNHASIDLRKPEDRCDRQVKGWIDGKIATPNDGGSFPSAVHGRRWGGLELHSPCHSLRCGATTPRRGQMRSACRHVHSSRLIASETHLAALGPSINLTKLREGYDSRKGCRMEDRELASPDAIEASPRQAARFWLISSRKPCLRIHWARARWVV